jgi:transcriptional regulator with GAF, ATPase, and Fis domain
VLAGRYRIEELLGRGGSALTWRALDLAEDTPVALKLLGDAPGASSFRAEFARLRELSHPHLSRVREYGRASIAGRLVPFFTSDLVVGGTLRAHCERFGLAACEPALRDALTALAFLHRLGLRHGDVKPENVLVDAAGRGVLIDLGYAVPVGSRELVGGTPAYMAPELARGEPGDERADLYAVGVMLRELGAEAALGELAQRLSRADVRARPSSLASACAECGLVWNFDSAPLGRATPMLGRTPQLRTACDALAQVARGARGPRVVWVQGARGVGTTRFLRELCFAVDPAFTLFEAHAARDTLHALLGRTFGPVQAGVEALVQTLAALSARAAPALLVWHDLERAPAEEQAQLLLALGATLAHGSLAWVVASTRPPPAALDPDSCLQLVLTPLAAAELSAWAGALVPESRIPALRDYTGGFPLQVERTLSALASGQLLVDALETAHRSAAISSPEVDAGLAALLVDLDAQDCAALAGVALGSAPASQPSARLFERGLLCEDARGIRLSRESDAEQILQTLPRPLVKQLSERAAAACERDQTPEACARRIAHLARAGQTQAALGLFADKLAAAQRKPRLFAASASALAEHMSAHELVPLAGLHRQSGEPRRALSLLARARRKAGAATPDDLYLEAAECYLALGDVARAARLLERVRSTSEPACAECLARIRVRQGDYAAARSLATRALAARPRGALLARLSESLALACCYLGEHQEAQARLDEAEAAESDPAPRVEARRWSLRGFLAMRRADPERALTAYERALTIADGLGLSDLVSNALLNLASARHMLGSYGNARDLYERAMRLARALGRRHSELLLRANLANLALECGAFDEAAKLLDTLEAVAGAPVLRGAVRRYRAELLLLTGHAHEALSLVEQPEMGDADERDAKECRLLAAEAQLALGAGDRAAACLAEPALCAPDSEPDLQARRELTSGLVALADGRHDAALACFERALSAARRAALTPLVARVEGALADLYARAGSPTLERDHRGRAEARWERMALDLPASARDAFWSHPLRVRARVAPAREQPGRSSLSFVRVVELSRRINAQRTINDVLAFALDAAIELTAAERGFVLLYDASTRTFEVKSARHVDNHPLTSAPFEWSRGIAERVIATGEPVITLDATHDARFRAQASVHAMGLKSVLCVPVMGTRNLKGALYLDNRYLRSRFTEADAELVQALAEQVAVALGNAQLFLELEQKQRELLRRQRKVEELLEGKEREVARLSEALAEERAAFATRFSYQEIVGTSPNLRRIFATLDRVIPTDLPVIVLGESGTGKELVARAIHSQGPRAGQPFVGINCGALPEPLLESELFGYVKGAFTGADRDKTGLFAAARGGTLFLDELGELPLSLQVKLLRVLTEREVRPLGATRSVGIDVRIVAATNRDLRGMVAEGSFREDLFYRLGVIEITLPPLRERKEDILPIAESLLARRAAQLGVTAKRLSSEAAQRLLAHRFPGNVRELENLLLRASALCEGDTIRAADLGMPVRSPSPAKKTPRSRSEFAGQEAELLLEALERERWNVSGVARSLGIPRNTLYRKLARLGLLASAPEPLPVRAARGPITSPRGSSDLRERSGRRSKS